MALRVNKLAQAISGVMAGINDGIEQAGNYVDVARPPEKVVFSTDVILEANFFKREKTESSSLAVKTITKPRIVEDVSITFNENATPAANFTNELSVSIQTTSVGKSMQRTYEDQSIGFTLNYPGPKSK